MEYRDTNYNEDGSNVLTSAARFHPSTLEWEVLPCLAEGAALHGCVYLCGGSNTCGPLSSGERFNPALHAWETVRPMFRQRSGAVSAVMGGALCVAGGGDGQQPLSSAERLVGDAWEVLPSMSCRRIRAAAAVLQNRWLVCGGGDGRYVLNSAELLMAPTSRWELLKPMNSPRWSSVAGVMAGCLYVCGGGDGESVLQSAERFNPMTGVWEEQQSRKSCNCELPPMSCPRWGATAVVADGLYVLGGSHKFGALGTAERLGPTSEVRGPGDDEAGGTKVGDDTGAPSPYGMEEEMYEEGYGMVRVLDANGRNSWC
eukprot:g25041.t1